MDFILHKTFSSLIKDICIVDAFSKGHVKHQNVKTKSNKLCSVGHIIPVLCY